MKDEREDRDLLRRSEGLGSMTLSSSLSVRTSWQKQNAVWVVVVGDYGAIIAVNATLKLQMLCLHLRIGNANMRLSAHKAC